MALDDRALLNATVANNGRWCDAVCRAHGSVTRCTPDVWCCDDPAPPFYPRLVSLSSDVDGDALAHLIASHHRPGAGDWAVKDSFAVLDGHHAAPGQRLLFTAWWYARPVGRAPGPSTRSIIVSSVEGLDRWITAWGETPPHSVVFPPALLAEPGVSFVHDSECRAGFIASRHADDPVIGISNLFGDPVRRNACIADLAARNPSRTLVGYGSPAEAESLAPLGFRTVAPLTVWLVTDDHP